MARIGELAAQEARRNPQATGREFARHITAVADAGLGEVDAAPAIESPYAVSVMALDSAKGREFRHVLILGLQSSRMPGARRAAVEPIPDALMREELRPIRATRTSARCGACCTSG